MPAHKLVLRCDLADSGILHGTIQKKNQRKWPTRISPPKSKKLFLLYE